MHTWTADFLTLCYLDDFIGVEKQLKEAKEVDHYINKLMEDLRLQLSLKIMFFLIKMLNGYALILTSKKRKLKYQMKTTRNIGM